jgi:alpha-beta hydrolase superfamily lysophospholipase
LYSNCIEDVKEVLDFFDTPENSKKYRIKPNSYILFGHSMGGGVALLGIANENRVKKSAIYSPAHIGAASQDLLDWVHD